MERPVGLLGGKEVEHLPLAQVMIPGFSDRVPHGALCLCLCLSVSLMIKFKKEVDLE